MPIERKIEHATTPTPPAPGFAGPQHAASEVIRPGDFARNNPFFLLMDDRFSADGPLGEEHPHAGLETVTLVLDGVLSDADGRLEAGDLEWMTAGRGIVHGEGMFGVAGSRVLQLWVVLPEAQRSMAPRVQVWRKADLPVRREPGVEVRVYSGRSGPMEAPTLNVAPVTLVDVELRPGAAFRQDLPSAYNGFAFVLEGEVAAGRPETTLSAGRVGWLDRPGDEGASELSLRAGPAGARLLIYAGEPQSMSIAARGPFIAGSEAELRERFAEFRAGKFARLSQLDPVS